MDFIDLKYQQQRIKAKLDTSIASVLQEGKYILGPEVSQLENELCKFSGAKYCLGVASGTDALLMALMSLDIGPGDEVITTPFTWISTVEAIRLLGAIPIYCDVDSKTYNIDPSKIQEKVSRKTKAILPVSLFGQCADYDLINQIAELNNISVIEDGAQSFGALYKDKRSCSLTTIGCTSFFPSKPLGCYGDGGACFTDSEEIYNKLKAIRLHGASSKNNFDYIGINGRLDTLQAAILLLKLEIFPEEIVLRQSKADNYNKLISDAQSNFDNNLYIEPPVIEDFNASVFAQYTLHTNNRPLVLERLKNQNIPFAIHYEKLTYDHSAYLDDSCNTPVARSHTEGVFSIPMHPYLSAGDQEKIINAIFEG